MRVLVYLVDRMTPVEVECHPELKSTYEQVADEVGELLVDSEFFQVVGINGAHIFRTSLVERIVVTAS